MRRKTEITIETEELIFYKTSQNLKGLCPNCQKLFEREIVTNREIILDVSAIEEIGGNEGTEDVRKLTE